MQGATRKKFIKKGRQVILVVSSENKEKRILLLSFAAGLLFAVAEFIFAIYSHSQSSLMDAAYDASELVFVALILFLTPLFYKPISEKRPYGFFQVESIFLIVKGFMMLSVTGSISATIIESALAGGNAVDGIQVSIFQLALGLVSILVFVIMKKLNKAISSPMVDAEILGWRVDIAYSVGMSIAFFISTFLGKTPLNYIAPYFDQIIAVVIVLFMLPETFKMLWSAIKDVFLFAPGQDTVDEIKDICNKILSENNFEPDFFDITRTGRHLWVAIYFSIEQECLYLEKLNSASLAVNGELEKHFQNCICELILVPKSTETG